MVSATIQAEVPGVPVPDKKFLFQADKRKAISARKAQVQQAIRPVGALDENVDFKGAQVESLQDTNEVRAKGGVVMSKGGVVLQADEGTLNTKTKDAAVAGHVVLSEARGLVNAESGSFNFDSETGTFKDARFQMEEGGYDVEAEKLDKISEDNFKACDSVLTTCHCPDGAKPWSIKAREANIQLNDYIKAQGATLNLFKLPVFYTPYMAFPASSGRKTGLLVPDFGYSSKDGFKLKQPFFWAIDESTDLLFAPFIETSTRVGSAVEYSETFSRQNQLRARLVYSDEGLRDGDLRGTRVSDLFDKHIDTNRFGFLYQQKWRSKEKDLPLSFVSNLHYVSDDLFPRELEEDDIARADSRFVTSNILVSGAISDFLFGEVGAEYNQSILTDDDLVFQRLPEASLYGFKTFRPFGYNPYGLKLATNAKLSMTAFERHDFYDGLRVDVNPKVRLPFHVKNYLDGQLDAGFRQTNYELNSRHDPDGGILDSSNSRSIYNLGAKIGTTLERVYDVGEGSWLGSISTLGAQNDGVKLLRVKNQIQPVLSYLYVPDVNQNDLPLFDSADRIRARSVVTYGIRSRLLGRFSARPEVAESIPELTPEVEDLPDLDYTRPLDVYDENGNIASLSQAVSLRRGQIRDLVGVGVKQSYDYRKDSDPWSDVGVNLDLYPTSYALLRLETNYNTSDNEFSSWSVGTALRDDRDDSLIGRYSFIDGRLSQIEGNLEIKLVDRFRLGYYARYDQRQSEFIQNYTGLRYESTCGCWKVDLGFSDKSNPDKRQYFLRLTLVGLGDS